MLAVKDPKITAQKAGQKHLQKLALHRGVNYYPWKEQCLTKERAEVFVPQERLVPCNV